MCVFQLTLAKSKLSLIFMTGGSFTMHIKEPTEVRLLFFLRNGEPGGRGAIFLGCKTGKKLLKIFTPQRGRERIYNDQVSKVL